MGKERRKLLILLSKIWKPEILNKDFIFSRTLKEKKNGFLLTSNYSTILFGLRH